MGYPGPMSYYFTSQFRQNNPLEFSSRHTSRSALVRLSLVITLFSIFFYDRGGAVIHPLTLHFGQPATATVTSRHSVSGTKGNDGNFIELEYQYSPGPTQHVQLSVCETAYQRLTESSRVQIHYLSGCSSCVELDNDDNYALGQGIVALFLGGLSLLFSFFIIKK